MENKREKNRNARKALGFRVDNNSAHVSRTMMLSELTLLLEGVPSSASKEEHRHAIIEENILRKRSASNRKISARELITLYALDPSVPIYKALRRYWDVDTKGRPLIAFLCAFARDPLLRLTAGGVMDAAPGAPVETEKLLKIVRKEAPGKYSPATERSISRNLRSTWTQSGHLTGKVKKIRTRPAATPAAAAFALYLGWLEGRKALRLLTSRWVAPLELPMDRLEKMIATASRAGLLDYKGAGGIIEIRFPDLPA
ncbi:MAG: hypothetical protein GY859_28955, partial [Desulfobacterales bacterium]|nr:hypothetical protein [Desulfobacterales bacterium]